MKNSKQSIQHLSVCVFWCFQHMWSFSTIFTGSGDPEEHKYLAPPTPPSHLENGEGHQGEVCREVTIGEGEERKVEKHNHCQKWNEKSLPNIDARNTSTSVTGL